MKKLLFSFLALVAAGAVIGFFLPDPIVLPLPAPRVGDVWYAEKSEGLWGGGPVWYEVIDVRDEWVTFRVHLDQAPTVRTNEFMVGDQHYTHTLRPDRIRPRSTFVGRLPATP